KRIVYKDRVSKESYNSSASSINTGKYTGTPDDALRLRDTLHILKLQREKAELRGKEGAESESVTSSFRELSQADDANNRTSFISIKDSPLGSRQSPLIQESPETKRKTTFQEPMLSARNWDSPLGSRQSPLIQESPETKRKTTFQEPMLSARKWNSEDNGMAAATNNHSVHIIPNIDREQTPDEVTFNGTRTVGTRQIHTQALGARGGHRDIGQTMRKVIAGEVIDEDTLNPNEVELREPTRTESEVKEKSRCMAGKCLMFILVVALLIAAVVVLAWRYRRDDDPTPLGQSFPDPVDYVECPSRQIAIGEQLNFTCSFDTNHAYRREFTNIDELVLVDKNNVTVPESEYELKYILYPENSPQRLLFLQRGPNMTCSRQGKYRIQLKLNGTNIPPEHDVTITVKSSDIKSETRQVLRKMDPYLGCDNETTQFNFTCTIKGDCSYYEVDFFGRTRTEENTFNHKIECEQSYDDANGSTQECRVVFTEAEVDDHHTLGCRFTDTKSNAIKESYLELPACGHSTNCTAIGSEWTINCTKKSDHLQTLDKADCNYYRFSRCFRGNRPIFRYNKTAVYELDQKTLCDDFNKANSKAVCRLGWCKDYDIITKYGNPGTELCPSTFDEAVVAPYDENNQATSPSTASVSSK
ncbi:uncharacterized protein LOC128219376, partial [Mya arenaria]|uniref:uncharacterized protein LOC128219376 n=1 Tax=Mya arenaria TaxID=6604 RepID=UPI0022DEDE44